MGVTLEDTIEQPTEEIINQSQGNSISGKTEDASSVEKPVPFFKEESVKDFLNDSTDVFGESETEEVFLEEKSH